MRTNAFRKLSRSKKSHTTAKKSSGFSSNGSGAFFQNATSGKYGLQSESPYAFFQPKLTTGRPGDKYEREADAIADKVTSNQPSGNIGHQQPISAVQKADLKEEEKPVQKAAEKKEEEKPLQKAAVKKEEEQPIQKAAVEKEEEKAVQKAPEKEEDQPLQKASEKEKEEPVQKAPEKEEEERVQMASDNDKEEEGVQAKEGGAKQFSGSAAVSAQLGKDSRSGMPLPAPIRQNMESGFGTSFQQVRIHTDANAVEMSRAIGAKAFTHGRDIYFNSGYYTPESQQGRHLLAHELTHVVQQNGGQSGAPGLQREVELDATRTPTGNFLFHIGPNLTPGFFSRFRQYLADGTLSAEELNRLRLYAIAHRGGLTQAEKLLMAAGLEPANNPLIAAYTTGVLSIPIANITNVNRDIVNNVGRGSLSPDYEASLVQAIMQLLQGNFEGAAAIWANLQEAAIQDIFAIGGTAWRAQAEDLVAFIEIHHLNAMSVLSAMYAAASDSSAADQLMAGIVYATALQAGHSAASGLASGSIKVDALTSSALAKLTGNAGGDAMYVPAGINDRLKSDTLYVPTSLNATSITQRALIIHELTHANDDAAAASIQASPQINFEMTAYRAQVRYIMDQILNLAVADREIEIFSTRRMADSPLFQWAYAVEARMNKPRYEAICKTILLQSATVAEADFNRVMAMPEADVLAEFRRAILSLPQYSTNPTVVMDGLKGESILDHAN